MNKLKDLEYEIVDNYYSDPKDLNGKLLKEINKEIKIIKEEIELLKEDQIKIKNDIKKIIREENKQVYDKLSVIEKILLENRSIYTNAIQKVSNQEEENSKTINEYIKNKEQIKLDKEKEDRITITPTTLVRENNRLWRQQSKNTPLSIFKIPKIFNP